MANMRAVTGELTLRIVNALQHGPLRFCEIDRAVNAPHHPALSARLKKMQRDGLIERRVHRLGPPAVVSYALTPLGTDLATPATALLQWAQDHADQVEAARAFSKSFASVSD